MTTDLAYAKTPAPFTPAVLDRMFELLPPGPARILDPFAGNGIRFHEAAIDRGYDSVGVELEPEFAAAHPRNIVGNATRLTRFDDDSFDAALSSPSYANRMCLAGDTMIATYRGHKPIAEVETGDLVLTRDGRFRRVLWSRQTGIQQTMTIDALGRLDLHATAEHRLWSRRRWTDGKGAIQHDAPSWRDALHLDRPAKSWRQESCQLAAPATFDVMAPECRVDAPFWRAIGRWLGDGWTYATRKPRQRKAKESDSWSDEAMTHAYVGWCDHPDKGDGLESELREAFGDKVRRATPTTAARCVVYDVVLLRWLEANFGKLAHGKDVPLWTLGLPAEARVALIEGWLAADGCEHDRGSCQVVIGVTVSRAMALGMQILAHSVGYSANVTQGKDARTEMVCGRESQCRASWRVEIWRTGSRCNHRVDDAVWSIVRSVRPDGDLAVPVFDLEVEDDHSFIANGVIVHNSDNYAGDAKGSKRITYRIALGRELTKGNTAGMPWGSAYRGMHKLAWAELRRVLKPGATFVLNVKDHIRDDVRQRVTNWHVTELLDLGFILVAAETIKTPGMRFGQNHGARVDGELVVAFELDPAVKDGRML